MFRYSKNLLMKMKGKRQRIRNPWSQRAQRNTLRIHSGGEKKDVEEYEPTTIRSFVTSSDRYLRKKGYPTDITWVHEFGKTRETQVTQQKELKKRERETRQWLLWNKLVPGSIKSTCSHGHIYGLVFSNKDGVVVVQPSWMRLSNTQA